MSKKSQARKWLLETALSYLGTPYRWGGDDPSGFDCSGLVVECLKSVGLLRPGEDLSADGLMSRFDDKTLDAPIPGALVFRLDKRGMARHVGVCLDQYFAIEAGGGDSSVSTTERAWLSDAWVRIRPIGAPTLRRVIVDPFCD